MEQQHHYFATHAMGWATGTTRDEALTELLLKNTYPTWAQNCLKAGEPLMVYSCRVEAPASFGYGIELFRPKGVETSEGESRLVTYLTKTTYATMLDRTDALQAALDGRIAQLRALAYAANSALGTPSNHRAMEEAQNLLANAFADVELFSK